MYKILNHAVRKFFRCVISIVNRSQEEIINFIIMQISLDMNADAAEH